jgi:hypothetical protein
VLPPFFVSKRIRQGEYERGRGNSRLGCSLVELERKWGRKKRKKMKFGEFGQNSLEF